MSLFDETFCRDRDTPPSADDPTGINAWAWTRGISAEAAHALVCSVLTGAAGPSFSGNVDLAGPVQPGLNIVARQGDHLLNAALAQLTENLWGSQKSLLDKSGDFATETLFQARFDGRKSRQAEDLQQIANHRSAGTLSSIEPHEQLRSDLQPVKESIRMDALRHPSFMLTGSLSTDLFKQLGNCHAGHGFYCGIPGPLPRAQGRGDQLLDQFLKFLLGTSVSCGNSKYPTPTDNRDVVLRGIFRFPDDDLDFLMRERRDLLANMVMVTSGAEIVEDLDPAQQALNYELGEKFLTRFHRVSHLGLANRREGYTTLRGFFAPVHLREFNRQQQRYLRELGGHPYAALTANAAQLPALLAWTLALLGPREGLDDYILATALPVAKRLAEAALEPFELLDQSSLIKERQRLAKKIIARLELMQPCKVRALIRGFDCQSMDLFRPVIDVLLSHGIMEQSSDKNLRLGQVPLSKLGDKKLILPHDL